MTARIGTAGWSIPRALAASFPGAGSHLERYARVLACAEINSTFYRPPRASTLAGWAATTPEDFRFSLKAPRAITHDAALAPAGTELEDFLAQARTLAGKLGPILFQLPPKQAFDAGRARAFLSRLRDLYPEGLVAFEPRHASWFDVEADGLLMEFEIARVAADPARVPEAAEPGGWSGLVYYRLHGSPRMYYSAYTPEYLAGLAAAIAKADGEVWVIFDNTASGAAARDALGLAALIGE